MNGKQLRCKIAAETERQIDREIAYIEKLIQLRSWAASIPDEAEFPIAGLFLTGELCLVSKESATAHDVAGSLARQCGLVFERGIFEVPGNASIEYSTKIAGINVKVWTPTDPTCRLVAIPKGEAQRYEYKIECPGSLAAAGVEA